MGLRGFYRSGFENLGLGGLAFIVRWGVMRTTKLRIAGIVLRVRIRLLFRSLFFWYIRGSFWGFVVFGVEELEFCCGFRLREF